MYNFADLRQNLIMGSSLCASSLPTMSLLCAAALPRKVFPQTHTAAQYKQLEAT